MREREDDEPLIRGLEELPRGSLRMPEAPPWLEQAVLDRTAIVVRSRGRRRRVRSLAVFVIVYAAGMGTTMLLGYGSFDLLRDSSEGTPRAVDRSEPVIGVREPPGESIEPAPVPSEILREVPGAPPERQRRLLKLAGDSYLSLHGDVERALYCYRQVLELTPPESKGIPESDDSWLLATLKLDQPST